MSVTESRTAGRRRTRKETPTVRALERGLLVLEVLAERSESSLSDIARETNLSYSTTFRILETLRQHGYVRQDDRVGHYHIGVRALQIGSAFTSGTPLPQAAHPIMTELVKAINETANLAVLDGDEAVYIHQVESRQSVRMFTRLGARVPLFCTGVGKILLAWEPVEKIKQLLSGCAFERYTPTTITGITAFLAELKQVRSQAYAVDDEEREPGVRCVTAAVRDAQGTVVAALSTSAPTSRLPKRLIAERSRDVLGAANEISARLGYLPRNL